MGKQSENTDFQQGTARRIIPISPAESWDLHLSIQSFLFFCACEHGRSLKLQGRPWSFSDLIMGNDHGIWTSENFGNVWHHVESLNLARSMAVDSDAGNNGFYNVYATFADSFPYRGPNRTREYVGIPNGAWHATMGSENGSIHPDPHVAGLSFMNGGSARAVGGLMTLAVILARKSFTASRPSTYGRPFLTMRAYMP